MVKIMENLIKMDDLGGKPTIFGNTHIFLYVWGLLFLWVVVIAKNATFHFLFKGNPERSFCFNDEWSSSGFLYEFFFADMHRF